MLIREPFHVLRKRECQRLWDAQERPLLLRVDWKTFDPHKDRPPAPESERIPGPHICSQPTCSGWHMWDTLTSDTIPVEIVESDEQVFEFVTEPYVLRELRYWSTIPDVVAVSIPTRAYPNIRKCLQRRKGRLWFGNLEVELIRVAKHDPWSRWPIPRFTYLL